MKAELRALVWQRAQHRCEYCHVPQSAVRLTFHIEHIVARQHHGPTEEQNLALACHLCNSFKGPNLSAIDPETGTIVNVFHPRQHQWDEHFVLVANEIKGITPIGRATVQLLNVNSVEQRERRAILS
jgi:hypothetical protein